MLFFPGLCFYSSGLTVYINTLPCERCLKSFDKSQKALPAIKFLSLAGGIDVS